MSKEYEFIFNRLTALSREVDDLKLSFQNPGYVPTMEELKKWDADAKAAHGSLGAVIKHGHDYLLRNIPSKSNFTLSEIIDIVGVSKGGTLKYGELEEGRIVSSVNHGNCSWHELADMLDVFAEDWTDKESESITKKLGLKDE